MNHCSKKQQTHPKKNFNKFLENRTPNSKIHSVRPHSVSNPRKRKREEFVQKSFSHRNSLPISSTPFNDIQPRQKRKLDHGNNSSQNPPQKSQRSREQFDSIGIICSLCEGQIRRLGNHQICSLGCGHVFGKSCISSSLQTNKSCPICYNEAYSSELRLIFLSNPIKVGNTSPVTPVTVVKEKIVEKVDNGIYEKKYISEMEKNRELQKENSRLRMKIDTLEKEITSYTMERDVTGELMDNENVDQAEISDSRCNFQVNDKFNLNGNIYIFTYDSNNLVFGVKGNSNSDNSIRFYDNNTMKVKSPEIKLHKSKISDMKISENMLITSSIDKSVKLIDVRTYKVVNDFSMIGEECYSLCWKNPNYFLVGCKNVIYEFDLRISKYFKLDVPKSNKMIHSIKYVCNSVVDGNLIGCKNGIFFFDKLNTNVLYSGNCNFCDFDPKSDKFLGTFDSIDNFVDNGEGSCKSIHRVFTVRQDLSLSSMEESEVFGGSSNRCRSLFIDDTIFSSQNDRVLKIWDLNEIDSSKEISVLTNQQLLNDWNVYYLGFLGSQIGVLCNNGSNKSTIVMLKKK